MPMSESDSMMRPPESPRGGRLPLESVRKLERMGQKAFAKGDYSDATGYTTKCVKALQAELASLLTLRAAIQLQQREYAAASADAENAIQLNKGWFKGYLRKGAILLSINEPMEAAEHLETALQLSPSNPEVKRTLREAYKAVSNNCYEQGHYEFAIRWCDHAIEILRSENKLSEIELAQQMAICYSCRSSSNFRQGNYREALRDGELAVFYNPWWSKGWLRKGTALSMLGTSLDLEAAVDSLEEGLSYDPNSHEIIRKLTEVRSRQQPLDDPFDTTLTDLLQLNDDPSLGQISCRPEDVPPFHEEWFRYQKHKTESTQDTLDTGIKLLYDSYLQARNIKLHLFSLETYDWNNEEEALWHRVGCSEEGMKWFKGSPRLGSVRDVKIESHAGMLAITNRSFTFIPPMKLTLQIHHTVRIVLFQFCDLLVEAMSTMVYADSASVLEIFGYESSTYSIAKSVVLLEMLQGDDTKASLDSILQVWVSSGWSNETEAAFRRACLRVCSGTSSQTLPYEAKIIIQIWSGAESIERQVSLRKWRTGHSKQDIGFLAANLRHCQDRADYCQYFLTGEIGECEVGSLTMFAEFSKVQSMVSSESILQGLPTAALHNAYHKEGTLFSTICSLLKRRLNIMRLRLRKRRLKIQFGISPVPHNSAQRNIPLSDPTVAAGLADISRLGATHFYWGTLPDELGPGGIHELVERCGAQHCKNYAQSLTWTTMTYGTHLLDYSREARCELMEALWTEAQHGIKAVGNSFMSDRPFAHPFHLCTWGLGKRHHKSWIQNFFLSQPAAQIHDVTCSEFNAFSLFPLSFCWTPQPARGEEGAVRSASPIVPLQTGDTVGNLSHTTHATTVQCHSCDKLVELEEKRGGGVASQGTGTFVVNELLDVMVNVFDDADQSM